MFLSWMSLISDDNYLNSLIWSTCSLFNQQGHSRKLISLNHSRVIGTTSPSTSEYDEVMQRRSEEEEKKDASFRALWHGQVLSRYRQREAVCSDQWWREGDVYPLIMWDFSKQTELVVMCCFLLLLTRTCVRLRCASLQSHQDLRLLREVPPSRRLPVDRKRCHILTQRNKNSFIFTARHLIKSNTIVTFSSKRSL